MENNNIFKSDRERVRVSKLMTHILRHNPEEYPLELDSWGYVEIDLLLKIIQKKIPWIKIYHLFYIERNCSKQRFEIKNHKIRARYGHTIKVKTISEKIIPPIFLYHGTSPRALSSIRQVGLKPMKRLWVHLTEDPQLAYEVGARHHPLPVVLKVKARKASEEGIIFRKEGKIFITKQIPPEFIKFTKTS